MSSSVFDVRCERIGRKNKYSLSFGYNPKLIGVLKSFDRESRKWNPQAKVWEVTTKTLFKLILTYKNDDDIFFKFPTDKDREIFIGLVEKEKQKHLESKRKKDQLEKNKKEWVEYKEYLENNLKTHGESLKKHLKPGIELYPHQIVAAHYINKVRNVLITHEMGLGKTLSSIVFTEMNDFDKVVVLTPNSLKFNFFNEVEKFTNSKAHIVNWGKNKYTIEESKYIILNYEFFNSKNKSVADHKWEKLGIKKIDALISDECQRIKNSKSNTYRNFKRIFSDKIFNGTPNKVFLSGTPAPNRAYELYNVLNQISPIEFPRKTDFYEHYCGMTFDSFTGWGYIIDTENQKFEELFQKISPYTHRKRKKDVLKDLPDKTYQKLILELDKSEVKEYENIEEETTSKIVPDIKPHHLSILMGVRKFLSRKKSEKIIEVVGDIVATGEKVVIIDFFKKPLYDLKEKLGDISVIHTGDQTIEERNEAIKKFQDPTSNIKVFLGGLDVTKEGLTLTASSKMFLLTLPFVPGVYDQISDRLHRIGQKNAVNIYIPVFDETIDLLTLDLLNDKKRELKTVIDNEKHVDEIKTNILENVFNYITNKYE